MNKQNGPAEAICNEAPPVPAISLQSVLPLIKEAIVILDRDARVVYVNEKANNIIHKLYSFHCRQGRSIFEVVPAERMEPLREVLSRCFSGEEVDYDIQVSRKAASYWINCRYTPIFENEQILGVSLVIEDVTLKRELEKEEQKRRDAEEKLIQTRKIFELFMEHAPLRAWITDSRGRVQYMNHQYRQAFGLDLSSTAGHSIFELFPQWARQFYREIQKVLEENKPSETIGQGIKGNGETGLFRITRFPLPVGNEVMVAGWAVEITEQVALQKKLIAEEKNKKRQIIRSIIETQEKERRELSVELHDNVNQILSSCQLMMEVAKDDPDAAPQLTEKTYHSLKTAIAEIRKISHELNPSAIEDLGLAEAITELVEKINIAGRLTVGFKYKEFGNKPLGATDKIAVYRIVQEQLSNILKHAGASHVNIVLYFKPSRIYLHIEDNGVGFDLKKTKKGIGLKNIQHRVEYYQGKFAMETSPGNGCKLKVLLMIPS
ncbi:MAG TPA: PAS domain-containing protein [Flavisolibacter sp.]|nr:PAS domain-containing protein [Flavisolibacter sp.]